MNTEPSISDHIRHAPSLLDLLALMRGLNAEPCFQFASTKTRRRWAEEAYKRIVIWMLTAPTARETSFIINCTISTHDYDAPEEWKEALRNMAVMRRAELDRLNSTPKP